MTPSTETATRFQCRHIHAQGHRCGSPSLRGEDFCYFHHTTRRPIPPAELTDRKSRQAAFDLPLPEDRGAIQFAIGEVLRRIAANTLDSRRAGLLLYGLQIASLNLPKAPRPARDEEKDVPESIEDLIQHPTHGPIAPIAELTEPEEELSIAGRLLRDLCGNDLDAAAAEITLPTVHAGTTPPLHKPCAPCPRRGNHQKPRQDRPSRAARGAFAAAASKGVALDVPAPRRLQRPKTTSITQESRS